MDGKLKRLRCFLTIKIILDLIVLFNILIQIIIQHGGVSRFKMNLNARLRVKTETKVRLQEDLKVKLDGVGSLKLLTS